MNAGCEILHRLWKRGHKSTGSHPACWLFQWMHQWTFKCDVMFSQNKLYRFIGETARQNNLVVENIHWKLLQTAVPNEYAYSHNSLLRSNPLYNCSRLLKNLGGLFVEVLMNSFYFLALWCLSRQLLHHEDRWAEVSACRGFHKKYTGSP